MEPARLAEKAWEIRSLVIKTLVKAGSGHSAGPLGSADFWAALYFYPLIKFDPQNPWWEERDRVVVDCGHYAPVIYTTLAMAGYFPVNELETLRMINSRLQGHPHARSLPGIETTSGPLGQGLSQAVGMALAARLDKKNTRVVCFMSDGGHDEGQTWEGHLAANKYKLSNLTVVIDRNNIQIDGHTEDVMPLESLRSKLESFNYSVREIDGHNFEEIISAFEFARTVYERPTAIIMRTIPGKGVEFMENDPEWHGKPPTAQEGVRALADINQIRTLGGRIVSEHQ